MKKIAILTIVAGLLALAAVASAKSFKQSGQIVGDRVSSVKLRVTTGKSGPKKVAGFKAKNVAVRCEKGPQRISLTALQPIDVARNNSFKVKLSDGEGGVLTIAGKVKNGGRATKGTVKTNTFKSSDGQKCKSPKQRFKTSK